MSENSLFANLFSEEAFSAASVVDIDEKVDFSDDNIYSPQLPTSGTPYKAIIRFLPYYKDPQNKSKIRKFQYFFRNQNGVKGGVFDCPSSLGKKHSSIFTDAFFTLREHPNALMQDLKTYFNRKVRYWSPVQIIQDTQNPELVGQIKIFRFGAQVNEIIEQIATGDDSLNLKAVNPYDLLNGKDLILIINKETYGNGNTGPSYKKSQFMASSNVAWVPGFNDNDRENKTKDGLQEAIFEYLKENTPDIDPYLYQPWDDATKQDAVNIVRTIVQDEGVFKAILKRSAKFGKDYSEFAKNSVKGVTTSKQEEPDALADMTIDSPPATPPTTDSQATSNIEDTLGDIDDDVMSIADEIVGNVAPDAPETSDGGTDTTDDMDDLLADIESLELK